MIETAATPRIVQAVYPQKGLVLIEGVNIMTKHLKPNAQNPQGGIVKARSTNQYLECDVVGC